MQAGRAGRRGMADPQRAEQGRAQPELTHEAWLNSVARKTWGCEGRVNARRSGWHHSHDLVMDATRQRLEMVRTCWQFSLAQGAFRPVRDGARGGGGPVPTPWVRVATGTASRSPRPPGWDRGREPVAMRRSTPGDASKSFEANAPAPVESWHPRRATAARTGPVMRRMDRIACPTASNSRRWLATVLDDAACCGHAAAVERPMPTPPGGVVHLHAGRQVAVWPGDLFELMRG